jgi:hypothetical protein
MNKKERNRTNKNIEGKWNKERRIKRNKQRKKYIKTKQ